MWLIDGSKLSVEVELVRHGRWIVIRAGYHAAAKCSECGKIIESKTGLGGIFSHKYCHICGSKMDGGEKRWAKQY